MPITLNFYLDSRSSKGNENKEYPIKLSITHKSQTTYLATGLRIQKNQWKNKRITGRPDKARLNNFLDSFKSEVRNVIFDERYACRYLEMTAVEIKKDIQKKLGKKESKSSSVTLLAVFEQFINGRNSERTKEIYRVTAQKIALLVPGAFSLAIGDVTLEWLEKFNDILVSRGNNPSTRNLDFRNIRAVLIHAEKHKLIIDNPFDRFVIPASTSPDRAMTIEQLVSLKNAYLEPWEEKYVDFFFLSFYLIGINTEDLLHLREIESNRVNYVRAKTHKRLSVKVEPEALEIIEKYKGKSYLLNILDSYASTHNWTSKVDATLKAIALRNGLPPITMYWARHTWATLAHVDLGIELSTVSDALGHQSDNRITLVYIKKKDYKKVDKANRKVIDYLKRLSHFESQRRV